VPRKHPVNDIAADYRPSHFAQGIDCLTQEYREQGLIGW
jgi:hypothetical protein